MRYLLDFLYESRIKDKDLETVKNLVSKYYKIPKDVLDNVRIEYKKLPEIWAVFVRKLGNYIQVIYRPLAKILGLYDPVKKEISIDYSLPYYHKIKTLIHEYVHAAQDYLGDIYKKSREKIEKEARLVTNYLFKIYNQASQKYPSFLNYLIQV